MVRVTGFARERFASDDPQRLQQRWFRCFTGEHRRLRLVGKHHASRRHAAVHDDEFPRALRGHAQCDCPQALVISEYFNYDRFGELVLAKPLDGETRAFTADGDRGAGSAAYLARNDLNLRSRITLDDNIGAQNPAVNRHPNGAPFSLTNYFRGGDTVANTVGVMGYDFNLLPNHADGAGRLHGGQPAALGSE